MAISNLLLRTSVVLLMVGLALGMAMGIKQNFLLAPAHAHLNLVGFVLMFVAGIYYRLVPQAAEGLLPKAQAGLHIVGAVAFPGALALMLIYGPHLEPFVVIGATIALAAMALFTIIVFRTTAAAAAARTSVQRTAEAPLRG